MLIAHHGRAAKSREVHPARSWARLMRMILVDHARAQHAAKRGGAQAPVTLDDCMAVSPDRAPDVLEIDQALDQLAAVDERKS